MASNPDGRNLICATRGARYDPATGECAGGPCAGQGLVRVAIEERDRDVRLANEDE